MIPSALVKHDKGTATRRAFLFAACAIVFCSCSTPFDMTGTRIGLPGPEETARTARRQASRSHLKSCRFSGAILMAPGLMRMSIS